MVAGLVASLKLPISDLRLESYRPPNGSDMDMLARYFWDIELSRAIMPAIHAVELSLRNSIHDAMTAHFGGDELWFYRPGVLEPGQLGQFAKALTDLSQRKAPPTPGRIIAETMFGFWVTMLSNPYEQRVWQPNGFAMLKSAFPHLHGRSIKSVHQHYNEIRKLRNRVSHHEAIWDRPNLSQEHANILDAIGWISPDLRSTIIHFDGFPAAYDHGRGFVSIQQELQTYLNLP